MKSGVSLGEYDGDFLDETRTSAETQTGAAMRAIIAIFRDIKHVVIVGKMLELIGAYMHE
jgi:hypothetical protein